MTMIAQSPVRRRFLKLGVLSCGAFHALFAPITAKETCEERINAMRSRFQRGLAEERARLFKTLIARYGRGILDRVRENTIREAESSLRESPIPTRNLEAVLDVLWRPSAGLLVYQIEHCTPESLKLRVIECLFATVMREQCAADVGEAFYCAYDHGFCAGLNPKIRFSRTRTLMDGADHCDHTYILKMN